MTVSLHPSKIEGIIVAPASKSSMQRACAAALLAGGETILRNPGTSNDDIAALGVIQALGAKVKDLPDGNINIFSEGIKPISNSVNCGESGLGIRMFAPVIALVKNAITIEGKGSLLQRPMDFFDEVLPKLGVTIQSNQGKLPLNLKGPLIPANIEIDGSLSSQFLTGLLFAYSVAAEGPVSIRVKNLASKPYIDLTLQVMEAFNMAVPENRHYEEFFFTEGSKSSSDGFHDYTVEGDWSGAGFLLVAGAIGEKVEVKGLNQASPQADKKILEAIIDAGAEVQINEGSIIVKRSSLNSFSFNASDCPDLFPPLVAMAAHCKGITRIQGLKRLKHKESDRGETLKQEFGKLGTLIELMGDEMLVHGKGFVQVKNETLHSHHDHRIAMACAIAAIGADKQVEIQEAEAVNKSYPDFWEDLRALGGNLKKN